VHCPIDAQTSAAEIDAVTIDVSQTGRWLGETGRIVVQVRIDIEPPTVDLRATADVDSKVLVLRRQLEAVIP
jgi:hypothetical protein